MTQYQDPEDAGFEPTPQTLKARQVLEELDEMRASGASIQAQFELLRKKLPQNEDLEDDRTPIDVQLERQGEARAGFRRVQEAMKNLMATWDGSTVLPAETKEVGGRLLNVLDQMRRQAEDDARKDWKSEIEMLAEIWPSSPDVSDYFQCSPIQLPRKLGKPSTPVEVELAEVELAEVELAEVELAEVELAEEGTDVKKTIRVENERLLEKIHEEILKEGAEQVSKRATEEAATKSRLEALDLEAKWRDEARVLEKPSVRGFPIEKEPEPEPLEKVVGPVLDPITHRRRIVPTPQPKKDEGDEGPNHLRRDAWAEALRELTALPWKFDRELHGRTGILGLEGDVLYFEAPSAEIFSARLAVVPVLDEQQDMRAAQITLHLQMGDEMHHLAETLPEDEAEKLHLDPLPFVKRALKNKTSPSGGSIWPCG